LSHYLAHRSPDNSMRQEGASFLELTDRSC
jgi:hypothetical protein